MKNGGVVVCAVVFFFLILLFCGGMGWSNHRTYNQCKRNFRQISNLNCVVDQNEIDSANKFCINSKNCSAADGCKRGHLCVADLPYCGSIPTRLCDASYGCKLSSNTCVVDQKEVNSANGACASSENCLYAAAPQQKFVNFCPTTTCYPEPEYTICTQGSGYTCIEGRWVLGRVSPSLPPCKRLPLEECVASDLTTDCWKFSSELCKFKRGCKIASSN